MSALHPKPALEAASPAPPPQPRLPRRAALLAGLMAGTAGFAQWATPQRMMAQEQPMPPLGELVPERFADWSGEDASRLQFVSPDVKAVLDTLYQQTLARVYRHPRLGQVMLAAAYGGDQSDATRAHRPEVCYPAQGFVVGSLERRQISLGLGPQRRELPVRRLVARLGSRHEPVTYWITVGGKVTTSGLEQKLAQMSYGLRGLVPDGLLMRISTVDRQTDRAWRVQSRFLEALCAAMPRAERWRVFGLEAQAAPPQQAPA